MKKLIFAFMGILTMSMEAQNITDVVRYSTSDLTGTARFRAMSGAFGALGGDLSSLDVNPAGSAVFLHSVTSLTLGMENTDTEVSFMNGFTSNSNSDFDLSQAGAVFVFNSNDPEAQWKKFSLGFNYSKIADLDKDFIASGINQRSIDRYFLEYADGVPLDLLEPLDNETISELYSYLGENEGFKAQQALLGYQAYIINAKNPDDLENTEYVSGLAPGSFDQTYSLSSTGLNGKFSFNFATQYQDDFYLGLNLNSHFINYERLTSTFETNSNPGSSVNEIYFEDMITTLGTGFSFQLGGLARLGDNVRAGFAFESPTWYTISEETTQYIETYSEEFGEAVVNPNVVNIYPDYKIQTPAKYTGSLAYLFGSQALISFDYSYKDYATAALKPEDDPAFSPENTRISNELKGASTYRVGGEYRISEWSLRGGYRFEQSPYVNETTVGDLTGYSLGLGYDFGNFEVDFAYDAYSQEFNPALYQTGLNDRAYITEDNRNFVLSLSFGI